MYCCKRLLYRTGCVELTPRYVIFGLIKGVNREAMRFYVLSACEGIKGIPIWTLINFSRISVKGNRIKAITGWPPLSGLQGVKFLFVPDGLTSTITHSSNRND